MKALVLVLCFVAVTARAEVPAQNTKPIPSTPSVLDPTPPPPTESFPNEPQSPTTDVSGKESRDLRQSQDRQSDSASQEKEDNRRAE